MAELDHIAKILVLKLAGFLLPRMPEQVILELVLATDHSRRIDSLAG